MLVKEAPKVCPNGCPHGLRLITGIVRTVGECVTNWECLNSRCEYGHGLQAPFLLRRSPSKAAAESETPNA